MNIAKGRSMSINPVVIAIPVYFLLIGIEFIVHRYNATKSYNLKDAMTNINCGVVSQITGAFLMVVLFGAYTYMEAHYGLFHIPMVWWAFPIAFITFDFMYYWAHRLSHEINLFWGGHSVHHQSEEYNLSVALRQSSTQILWTFLFYLPIALLGVDPIVFIVAQGINLVYQFWIHTESIEKMPKWFEAVFNTPSHHRVHHARNPKYIDKNHAGTLIIWDKLFGSFAAEEERPQYGITKPLKSWNPVWANFAHYSEIYKDLKQISGFRDKIRLLVNKPGWKPDYLGGYTAAPDIDPNYQKFQFKTSLRLNVYVVVQFIIIMATTLLFLYYLKEMDTVQKAISAGLIIYSVASFGLLFESRKWSRALETIRIVAMPLAFIYIFGKFDPGITLLIIAAAYLIMSLVWFNTTRQHINTINT